MLRPADLAAYDLPALSAALTGIAARRAVQHRAAERLLREADAEFGSTEGLPETRAAVAQICTDSITCSRAADLVDLLRRFAADEGHRTPAPVLRLVPPAEREPAPTRPSLLARTLAALGRGPTPRADEDAA